MTPEEHLKRAKLLELQAIVDKHHGRDIEAEVNIQRALLNIELAAYSGEGAPPVRYAWTGAYWHDGRRVVQQVMP
jgi:hypothetical protein